MDYLLLNFRVISWHCLLLSRHIGNWGLKGRVSFEVITIIITLFLSMFLFSSDINIWRIRVNPYSAYVKNYVEWIIIPWNYIMAKYGVTTLSPNLSILKLASTIYYIRQDDAYKTAMLVKLDSENRILFLPLVFHESSLPFS